MADLGLLVDSIGMSQTQVIPKYDRERAILWYFMNPHPRPCISQGVIEGLGVCRRLIENWNGRHRGPAKDVPIRYGVLASAIPGTFSFGGDLELFSRCIKEGDRDRLRAYALQCVDLVSGNWNSFGVPMTTYSLVQGEALGGGFEAAMSSHVLVAEKGSQFGFPEVLFNLFPGMGAYSLLARRLDARRAEEIIWSGKIYTAEEMHGMGVVDILAEAGEGEAALRESIDRSSRKSNTHQALVRVRQSLRPLPLAELVEIAEIWVDAAFSLEPKDLRLMDRLRKAQERVPEGSRIFPEAHPLRA